MENKFIALAVGLTVGVIMLSGFLWPVVADATATTDKFTNDGYFKMTKYEEDTDITIEWDYTDPTKVVVNGETQTLSNNVSVTIAFVENAGIRIYSTQSGMQALMPQGTMAADVGESETMTVVFSEGTVTATIPRVGDDDLTLSTTYTAPIYCISSDGNYVMKKSNESAYMLKDTEFIGLGVTTITGAGSKVILVKGTIEDGATATIVTTSGTAATLTDPVLTTASVAGYVDLYQLDKITFAGQVEGSADTNITYSYFVVPAEVTAEKAQHLDTTQIALVAAIGTLGAIVLIAAAAGSIRRLD